MLIFKFNPISCSIHKGYCFHQGLLSPISDLTERLLLEERDPPATPQESSYEAPPFDEVKVLKFSTAVIILDAVEELLSEFPCISVE